MTIERLICVAALLLLSGCAQQQVRYWRADDIAAMASSHVRLTESDEAAGTVSTDRVRRTIAVRDRIAQIAGQQAQLVIAGGIEPNASAGIVQGVPTVAINIGMLELLGDDDDAYAAILGHEIAHLTLNHRSQRQERETTRQGFSQLIAMVLGFVGVPMGGAIAEVTTTAVSRVYSRDDEREADRIGFDYMRRAGFDPRGAVRVWQRMATQRTFAIPFLATHPASEERLESMRKMAGE
jgi:Zn-dependent protease with chaperone function